MIKWLGMPALASEHGGKVDYFILYVHWLMGALFIGWLVYFLFVLFRFRQRKNPRANYAGTKSHTSTYVEVAVVACEAILLIGFAVPLWSSAVDDFPPAEDSTVIRVVAEQFLWNSLYPGADGVLGRRDQGLVTADNPLGRDFDDPAGQDDIQGSPNEIVVPVNRPVIAHISSKDVVHSFKINSFRVTQDAIPGLTIPVHFTPTQEGSFLLNCAQLCGNSHYYMKGTIRVVSQDAFEDWVEQRMASAATSTSAGGFE